MHGRSILPRVTALLILTIILLSNASQIVRAAPYDPKQAGIINALEPVAGLPFQDCIASADAGSPLTLRRAAFSALIPFASLTSSASASASSKSPLPGEIVNRIIEDNVFFVDSGRISNGSVLDHDRDLAKLLVKLYRGEANSARSSAYLRGLVLLAMADRLVAEISLNDARLAVNTSASALALSPTSSPVSSATAIASSVTRSHTRRVALSTRL